MSLADATPPQSLNTPQEDRAQKTPKLRMREGPLAKQAEKIAPYGLQIAAIGGFSCLFALALPITQLGLLFFGAGAVLIWCALLVWLISWRQKYLRRRLHDTLAEFVAFDAAPAFTTNIDGVIGYQNSAAIKRFGGKDGHTLLAALEDVFAAPAATLARLQSRAQRHISLRRPGAPHSSLLIHAPRVWTKQRRSAAAGAELAELMLS